MPIPVRDMTTVDQVLEALRVSPRDVPVVMRYTDFGRWETVTHVRSIVTGPVEVGPLSLPRAVILWGGIVPGMAFCPACHRKLRGELASDLMR